MATKAAATARYNSLNPLRIASSSDFSLLSFKLGLYAGTQMTLLGLTCPSLFRGLVPAVSFGLQLEWTLVNVLWNLSFFYPAPQNGALQLGSNVLDLLTKATAVGFIGFYLVLYSIPARDLVAKSRWRWTAFLVSGLIAAILANSLLSISVFISMDSTGLTVLSIWYQYVEVYIGVLLILSLARFARFKYGARNVGQVWDILGFLSLEWMAITLFLSVLISVFFLVSSYLEYDPDLNFAACVTGIKYYSATAIAVEMIGTPDPRSSMKKKNKTELTTEKLSLNHTDPTILGSNQTILVSSPADIPSETIGSSSSSLSCFC